VEGQPDTISGTIRKADASLSPDAVSYEAFTELALSYFRELYGTAQRLTRNTIDADDLVQDTYHLALLHYRELRSLTHCRPWLYRILRRRAVTQYRRQRSGVAVGPMSGEVSDSGETVASPTFDDDLLEHISLQEIRDAINALPADLRVVMMLRDIEGFSYAEIADIEECPVGTVRSRIARARGRLMRKLQTHAADRGIGHNTA
jgi:RNA polymerase sigma-70 factor (ECF subfamily)